MNADKLSVVLSVYLSMFSPHASAKTPVFTQPPATIKQALHFTANQHDCIEALPGKLLVVTPDNKLKNRQYKIAQIDGWYDYTYGLPMKQQLAEKKILGTRICNGIVSLSNMSLPFAKNPGHINDANDGLLLIKYAENTIGSVQDLLFQMSNIAEDVARHSHTQTEIDTLNNQFDLYKKSIDRVAYSAAFNGIYIANGDVNYIDVPVHPDKNGRSIRIALSNLTLETAGLNLTDVNVANLTNATKANAVLQHVLNNVAANLHQLKQNQPTLQTLAARQGVLTIIDLNSDKMIVKSQPLLSAISKSVAQTRNT